MKIKLLFLLVSLYTQQVFSQATIIGSVKDSVLNKSLTGATVTILKAKDSILVNYSYTNQNGQFKNLVPVEKFLIIVSYPGYVDYVIPSVAVDADLKLIGTINLSLKARLLNEVVIKAKPVDIKIKGDTTEFNAAAYVIQPHSKVEDLLKQFPGLQVEPSGKITAYGQKVKKVLVEGEEFFGDDPTLVTRNLRADMVDKIQLYHKKSDFSTLTGIDDGVRDKVLNVKLKDNKKNGYFGKISVGQGTSGYNDYQTMFNRFTEASKFAMYGNGANTGKVGLNSSDRDKYGTTGGSLEFIAGGIAITGVKYDELSTSSGRYDGVGFPDALSGGTHLDKKWNQDKESINLNIKTGKLKVNGYKQLLSENNLPNESFSNKSDLNFDKKIVRSTIDMSYQYKMDTNTTLKISLDGLLRNTDNTDVSSALLKNQNGNIASTAQRTLTEDGNQNNLDLSASLVKKINNNGSSASIVIGNSYYNLSSEGYLNAFNRNFGIIQTDTRLDQFKDNKITTNLTNITLSYSEGISKSLKALFSYGIGLMTNNTDRSTFEKGTNDSYNELNKDFSAYFQLRQIANQLGVTFNYQKGKHTFDIGNKTSITNFNQKDKILNNNLERNFLVWNPQASYRYRLTKNAGTFIANYNGKGNLPAAEQLIPLNINNDPLNIIKGNPGLRPSYSHNLTVSYNAYNPIKKLYINIVSDYTLITNPVTTDITTDEFGQTVFLPINLKKHNADEAVVRFSVGKKLKKLDISSNLSMSFLYADSYSIINGILQNRSLRNYSVGPYLNKFTKKYNATLSVNTFYSQNYTSLANQLNNNRKGITAFLGFGINFPSDIELSTTTNYQYQGKTEAFQEPLEMVIVNANLSKRFLKSKAIKVEINANDLFKQNKGFTTSSFGSFVYQNTYSTIQRYFLFSLIWDFSKF